MKYRESGMPSEEMWDTFFSPTEVLEQMGINKQIRTLIDIGCGYGTFLLPASELVSEKVIGIDIDKDMIVICQKKIHDSNISNIKLIHGDISKKDTVKAFNQCTNGIDYITLFNILHCEEPVVLLKTLYNFLNKNGRIGVMHWKNEETPRGPSIDIRPKPEAIIDWAIQAGFVLEKQVELPPYHFGLVFTKN